MGITKVHSEGCRHLTHLEDFAEALEDSGLAALRESTKVSHRRVINRTFSIPAQKLLRLQDKPHGDFNVFTPPVQNGRLAVREENNKTVTFKNSLRV